jgi:hypothetical protein
MKKRVAVWGLSPLRGLIHLCNVVFAPECMGLDVEVETPCPGIGTV